MSIEKEESFGIIPLRKTESGWQVFLILHKHGDHWAFPKGKADESESPFESAKRELEEETALVVEKVLIEEPISEQYTFFRRGKKVEKRVHYFPAIVSGAILLQPEEIRDGEWLSLNQAHDRLTFDEAKRICKKVEEDYAN